jgi:hypothetical protein
MQGYHLGERHEVFDRIAEYVDSSGPTDFLLRPGANEHQLRDSRGPNGR